MYKKKVIKMNLYNIRKQLSEGTQLSNINLKVTYYGRVSTDNIDQQTSLDNQNTYFQEMIKANKNWTYIEGYIDKGISGTTSLKRINFMKMIEDAKNNKFDLIITKEISRFSRNTLDSIKYTRELLEYGVAVLFLNDNINTILPDSELRLTIMSSLAQDEIRRLSERVKFGMNEAIKKGKILGHNNLYGYNKTKDNKLIIDKKQAKIIEEIYLKYTKEKYSLSKIAKLLNERNIKTKNNKNWTQTSIKRIIENPKYKGYYCGKKSEVTNYMTKKVQLIPANMWITYKDEERIPPIINEYLWKKANNRLKRKATISKK